MWYMLCDKAYTIFYAITYKLKIFIVIRGKSMSKRQYEYVWDTIDRKWKTPEEIEYSIMRDKLRFISEKPNINGDGGYILAFYKGTSRKLKNGKKCEVRPYFKPLRTLGLNIYENREKIKQREIGRESDVHKLCKQLFTEGVIKDIHLESLRVPVVIGTIERYLEIPEQDIKVISIEGTEIRDTQSNRIPDITIKAEICGIIQTFFVEIYYRHSVDQYKKNLYEANDINCIEIDVGNVYEEAKNDSPEELRKALIDNIANNAHWISCRFKQLIKKGIHENYSIINCNTVLRRSRHEILDKFNRAFIFEDDLKLNGSDRVCKKAHNIGDCLECSRCMGIKSYYSDDLREVEITCSVDSLPKGLSEEQRLKLLKDKVYNYIKENM